MNFVKTLLITPAAFFGLLSSLAAETVEVPVTLALDPPAASAPGINHLLIELDGGDIGNDSDNSRLTGTIEAVVRLNVDNPDIPVITGLQFLSGDFSFENTSFHLSVFLVSNITIAGTGVGGTVFTPSAKPEPVNGNTFDASLHTIEINEGTLEATGTVLIIVPVNETQDLSLNPLSGPASGAGATSIALLPSTPTHYTYAIGMSVPVLFQDTIPVTTDVNIDTTISGSLAATGQVTVVILPKLKPVIKSPTGFELEITGKVGANVVLCASENLATWTDIDTLTLALPVTPYCDTGAIGLTERYYRFREP